MNVNQMFPSKYVNASDLAGREITVTIARVQMERLKGQDGVETDKPIVFFVNAKKGLILNKTNARAIAALHGSDTDQWTGKPVILCPVQVVAFGKPQDAVRVKGVTQPATSEPTL